MRKRIACVSLAFLCLLVSAYPQTTQLFAVVQKGTPREVQAAIDGGGDVNARDKGGTTPLIWAAGVNPDPEVITTLLRAGADLELRGAVEGITALMSASWSSSNPEVVNRLLKAGADLTARDEKYGRTALIWATQATRPNAETIVLLLQAGIDAKVQDKLGSTAFDYAEYKETLKGTEALKRLEQASR